MSAAARSKTRSPLPGSCAWCPERRNDAACHNAVVRTRRDFLASAAALLAGAGCVGRGGSSAETFPADIFQGSDETPEKTMTLVGRRSELPTQALSDFQIRTGVTVTTESAGGDDTLLLRLAAGGYGEFDVIMVSGDTLAYLVESQQVEPLARKLIPNLSALRPPFDDSPDDNGLRHDVPASYDIVGVAVSPVALIESESWTALFSLAERHPGRVVVPDDADDVIGAVLVSLGHAWDTDSNSDLDDAATRLGELFPALRVSGRRPGGGRPVSASTPLALLTRAPQLPAHVDRPALLRSQRGLGAGRAKLLHPRLRPAPGGRARVAERVARTERRGGRRGRAAAARAARAGAAADRSRSWLRTRPSARRCRCWP